jgi:putative inorganic carbon (hco3(-)) transporter
MPADRPERPDYKPLSPVTKNGGTSPRGQASLKPGTNLTSGKPTPQPHNLTNPHHQQNQVPVGPISETKESPIPEPVFSSAEKPPKKKTAGADDLSYSEKKRHEKKVKKTETDNKLLASDRWLVRNGHAVTYTGLYLFSIMVLYRPYELVSGLSFLSATAFYFAIATLAIYFPAQLIAEGNLTMLSTEVKAILAMTVISLITMPIAKDPGMAWDTFNDSFSKSVIIFIVLVNVVRTRKRLMGLMWLSFGIGVYLSFMALDLYMKGDFNVEGYRVAVDVGGMFGNPNEMALHFVMMTPIVVTLGIASKSSFARWIYFGMAALLVGANMVTFSRGGFLGLLATAAVLAWKIGRKQRLNVTIASIVVGGIAILAAPGNYGLRMLSIFIPGLDAVGSSDQRRELLERSIQVTLRNPWGIGIGNFPIVGVRNLQTHNAFTQVSSEIGLLGLAAYLVFIISPFRKLGAIERTLYEKGNTGWFYYVSIGLQASIVGYMASSFFAAVAYNWFIYYLIAYAVAFRRIYMVEKGIEEEIKPASVLGWRPA